MPDHSVCDILRKWAVLRLESLKARAENPSCPEYERTHAREEYERFRDARSVVELAVMKSCLLDRMVNHGEQPSQTPCPVHQGRWSGIQAGWPVEAPLSQHVMPVTMHPDGTVTPGVSYVSEQCQQWYDAGCRCFMHKCGCTTGWQPDEHCGCGVQP